MMAFGEKPLAEVTSDDVEALRAARRAAYKKAAEDLAEAERIETKAASTSDRKAAAALREQARALRRAAQVRGGVNRGENGINRLLAPLRHMCNWALRKRITNSTPFRHQGAVVISLETANGVEEGRFRRLNPGEEPRLMAEASPHLQVMIQAALETGCRVGELLGLRWCDVEFDTEGVPRRIKFAARTTKTSKTRRLPVTSRLAAIMMARRKGPDRREHGPLAYVFGNEAGERIARTVKGWSAACERAGIEDLHFHDLRREFGLRLHERGVPLSSIQAALGHSNIVMTSRYLRIEEEALGEVFALLG